MRIWVQKSASMQMRTSPLKFGDLAEKSGLNSVSNLSTKAQALGGFGRADDPRIRRVERRQRRRSRDTRTPLGWRQLGAVGPGALRPVVR